MFQRIARVFKSWIGYFISFAEDPEVMLQESIEEMRNTLPKLNQILITTRATVIRLEQGKEALERREKQLVNSIKAALTEGSPESRRLAEDDAASLQQVRQELADHQRPARGGQQGLRELPDHGRGHQAEAAAEDGGEPQGDHRVAQRRGAPQRRLGHRRARHLRHRRHQRQVPGRDPAEVGRGQGRRRGGHRRARRRADQERAQGPLAAGAERAQRVRGGDGPEEARRRARGRPLPDRSDPDRHAAEAARSGGRDEDRSRCPKPPPRPRPAVFLDSLPPWASELVRAVTAKQSNTFVLHGVPADLVPVRGPAGLRFLSLDDFLVQQLFARLAVDRHLQPRRRARLRHPGGAQPLPGPAARLRHRPRHQLGGLPAARRRQLLRPPRLLLPALRLGCSRPGRWCCCCRSPRPSSPRPRWPTAPPRTAPSSSTCGSGRRTRCCWPRTSSS